MTKLGKWFHERELQKLWSDEMIYGVSIHHLFYRAPWNPLKYILGEVKITRLNPKAIIITNRR